MRTVPSTMSAIWRSGDYTGSQRPFARVTVQGLWAKYGGKAVNLTNLYSSVAFHAGGAVPIELPNVRRVSIQKSADNDVDQLTMELYNTAPMPLGAIPERDDFGFYTFLRGESSFASRWDITPNRFSQALLPDNIIRTYEGYGFDPDVIPERDTHLVQTGFWLIDDIDYTVSSGIIRITARDARRVLAEEVLRPPVCREPYYPLSFTSTRYAQVDPLTGNGIPGEVLNADQLNSAIAKHVPGWDYLTTLLTKPITDPIIVHTDGTIGHLGYLKPLTMQYDASSGTLLTQGGSTPQTLFTAAASERHPRPGGAPFWMSEGHPRQFPRGGEAKPYLQTKLAPSYITRARVRTMHKYEQVSVAMWADGAWVDRGLGNIDGIPIMGSFAQQNEGTYLTKNATTGPFIFDITIPDPVENVTKVRFIFAGLAEEAQIVRNGHFEYAGGGANPWHAKVYNVSVFGNVAKPGDYLAPPSPAENPHYYNDFTEIIKLFCAWGVFWWPPDASYLLSDGTRVPHHPDRKDTTLGYANNGRVYGDFEDTGTSGPATMDATVWTNQSLADGISYIKGNIGFVFLADELGGVIWRRANIYSPGNWRGPEEIGTEATRPVRTTEMVTIDELVTLIDLTPKVSGRNAREAIVISSNDGRFSAGNTGFQLNRVNLRRVGGWYDNGFVSNAECQMMADRIAIAQAMTARTYTVTIPGYPCIQLDDQVRVFERTSSEGYIHYVNGINSDNNLESGEWTYQLDTYWLGDRPDGKWGFDLRELSAYTLNLLMARGTITPDVGLWGLANKKHAPQNWGATAGKHGGNGW